MEKQKWQHSAGERGCQLNEARDGSAARQQDQVLVLKMALTLGPSNDGAKNLRHCE